MLVFIGFGLNRTVDSDELGTSFLKFIYPGMIAMVVSQTCLQSAIHIFWDRHYGYLKAVLVAPVGRSGIVVGKIIGAASVSAFQVVVVLAFAPAVGISLKGWVLLEMAGVLLLFAFAMGSLGVLIGVRLRSVQSASLAGVVLFPLTFISGMFFPINNVPTWLGVLSKVNPISYPVAGIRQAISPAAYGGEEVDGFIGAVGLEVFGHEMALWENSIVTLGLGLALFTLALFSFRRS